MTEQDVLAPQLEGAPTREAESEMRGAERRRSRRFRAFERRSGFDRRRRYPITGPLRESPAMLLAVLVATNALSAIDFWLTQAQLERGTIEEGNPLLAALFQQGVGQAWLFKTLVVLGVSLVIWHQRKYRSMLSVAVVGLVVYLLVVAYHLLGIVLFASV